MTGVCGAGPGVGGGLRDSRRAGRLPLGSLTASPPLSAVVRPALRTNWHAVEDVRDALPWPSSISRMGGSAGMAMVVALPVDMLSKGLIGMGVAGRARAVGVRALSSWAPLLVDPFCLSRVRLAGERARWCCARGVISGEEGSSKAGK